jgi:hypothetical protein
MEAGGVSVDAPVRVQVGIDAAVVVNHHVCVRSIGCIPSRLSEEQMASRASNGRSSIYRGSDGSWHGRVTMGVRPDGRPDRRHVRGRTQKDVTAKVRDLESRRAAGVAGDPGRAPTVEAWLVHWLQNIAAPEYA